jgi:hypothetical protein
VAQSANHDPGQNVARVIVPAINDMIDITTVRTVALHTVMPRAILLLLLTAALCSAMTAGYAMATARASQHPARDPVRHVDRDDHLRRARSRASPARADSS